jgi:hypothetical protein
MATKPKPPLQKNTRLPKLTKAARAKRDAENAKSKSTSKVGRPSNAVESGRYTPPIPKNVRRSRREFGLLILVLLLGGVLMILLNYLNTLPGGVSGWYLIGGLAMIFAGFIAATRYR